MAKRSSDEVKRIVEALLFASPSPLSAKRMSSAIGDTDVRAIKKAIDQLAQEYDDTGRAFQVQEIADGYQIRTRPEYADWVQYLKRERDESRLSPAALETLAIVAYKQPVTRAEIAAVRGVESDEVVRSLAHRGLIRIKGRREEPGRPLEYETTHFFLEKFGISSLHDLPKLEEILPPDTGFKAGRT